MRGYPIDQAALRAKIQAFNGDTKPKAGKPTKGAQWLVEAAAATAACLAAQDFVESNAADWGKIKDLFIEHQEGKCAYCEKMMEGKAGRGDYDVEHFRPKSKVKDWFAKSGGELLADWPVGLNAGAAQATGYFLLPYEPLNYAVACKTCNSNLKSDYFPIGGAADLAGTDPSAMYAVEQPWLIFPLGSWEPPPETLITFEGITAMPRPDPGADVTGYWRARLTIAFFHLNREKPLSQSADLGDEGRENLYRARAEQLHSLAKSLDALETLGDAGSAAKRQMHQEDIIRLCSVKSPHSLCCLCFAELWQKNKPRAVELWEAIWRYLQSATATG